MKILVDNRASAPPPSTYKSPPSQHPNNARPQVPPQHIVTKSSSYTHETGHYQQQQHYSQQAYKPPQVVRTGPSPAQWKPGYQYPVNVNQPQAKPGYLKHALLKVISFKSNLPGLSFFAKIRIQPDPEF